MGNQTGPRQFELPPYMAVLDSAGSYRIVASGTPGTE